LTHYLTPFVGQRQEVAEIRGLLAGRRLITLTGPGGSGKTRLAVEVAAGLAAEFSDGRWLAQLAELTEAALVPQAVTAALGLREAPGQTTLETIVHFLNGRHALLLLDNCEHLLDACARLAAHLLPNCPHLRLLATSREALGLPGEIVRPMLPLELPSPHTQPDPAALSQVEAVALFLDRASALAPDFALNEQNATAVSQICRLLDGMPLAIELAAARVPVLSVSQIAARLDDSLHLLAVGPRLVQPRHQTMRAAVDWSYNLLSEAEQILWRRLSVFRGPFSLAAAEAVCSEQSAVNSEQSAALFTEYCLLPTEILNLLTELVHKSLVLVVREAGEACYRLLEPLRQYAAEKLEAAGEAAVCQQRHYNYYLAWAEQHEARLRGPEQPEYLAQFEARYPNLRAALVWSLREPQSGETGLRLAVAMGPYWYLRNVLTEGRRWLEEALARSALATPTIARGQALFFASVLAWFQGDIPAARQHIEEGYAIAFSLEYEGQWGIAHTLTMLGQVVRFQGEEEAALRYLRQSAARFRRSGDRWGLALALDSLASISRQVGDMEADYSAISESRDLWRAIGDPWGLALNRLQFFERAWAQEEYATAQALYEDNRATLEALGYIWHLSGMYLGLAGMALGREDYPAAAGHYGRCLPLARQMGDEVREATALVGLGAAALGQGSLAEAVTHCQAGLLLFEKQQRPLAAAAYLERLAAVAERTGYGRPVARLQSAAAALRATAVASPDRPADQAPAFAEA
jgi:predicted ATPase